VDVSIRNVGLHLRPTIFSLILLKIISYIVIGLITIYAFILSLQVLSPFES
jgi:hypothetical protein